MIVYIINQLDSDYFPHLSHNIGVNNKKVCSNSNSNSINIHHTIYSKKKSKSEIKDTYVTLIYSNTNM